MEKRVNMVVVVVVGCETERDRERERERETERGAEKSGILWMWSACDYTHMGIS